MQVNQDDYASSTGAVKILEFGKALFALWQKQGSAFPTASPLSGGIGTLEDLAALTATAGGKTNGQKYVKI